MTRLQALYLSGNELNGRIPDALGNLVNLRGLGLSWNGLSGGPVPAWLGNLTSLRWLYLSGSGLTGPIPNHLARLGNLRSLYLSGNELNGPIPAWLGNLTGLEDLSLGGNLLTGPIPDVPGSLTNLETLDLSGAWGLSPGPVSAGLWRRAGLRDRAVFAKGTRSRSRARVSEDDEALRPDGAHGDGRRDRAHRDLSVDVPCGPGRELRAVRWPPAYGIDKPA